MIFECNRDFICSVAASSEEKPKSSKTFRSLLGTFGLLLLLYGRRSVVSFANELHTLFRFLNITLGSLIRLFCEAMQHIDPTRMKPVNESIPKVGILSENLIRTG